MNRDATKEEAIDLLRRNSGAATTAIRALTDAQLDRTVPSSMYSDAPLPCQFFLEDHAVRHSYHHLAKIRGPSSGESLMKRIQILTTVVAVATAVAAFACGDSTPPKPEGIAALRQSLAPPTAKPPVLFGQEFMPDRTFQLWGLHVWTRRANPGGTFAMWNPRVHC